MERKAGGGSGQLGDRTRPLASQLVFPPRPLLSQEAGEGRRVVEEAQGEEPRPLSSVNLAGPVRSKSCLSFLCMLGRLPGLATGSPDFKGGLLVAAACSRASLSGHWRP